MTYLAMALFAEGPTDHAFLEPVIRRSLGDCARRLREDSLIEIAPFVELPKVSRENDAIVDAVQCALAGIHVFFLHADGRGQPERAMEERVLPVFESLRARIAADRLGCVGLVPVHETEAWPLADPECIRRAFGTSRSGVELGLPTNPHEVEREPDPKRRLEQVWLDAQRIRRSRRRRRGFGPYLTLLGETIDLERLRRVPAYQRFERDLMDALRELIPPS